ETVTPSPHHPLGCKGVGESATVGSPAAVVNAVIDALAPFGVRHADMPLTPAQVWLAIQGRPARTDLAFGRDGAGPWTGGGGAGELAGGGGPGGGAAGAARPLRPRPGGAGRATGVGPARRRGSGPGRRDGGRVRRRDVRRRGGPGPRPGRPRR